MTLCGKTSKTSSITSKQDRESDEEILMETAGAFGSEREGVEESVVERVCEGVRVSASLRGFCGYAVCSMYAIVYGGGILWVNDGRAGWSFAATPPIGTSRKQNANGY